MYVQINIPLAAMHCRMSLLHTFPSVAYFHKYRKPDHHKSMPELHTSSLHLHTPAPEKYINIKTLNVVCRLVYPAWR